MLVGNFYHGSVTRTNQSAIFSSIENFKIGVQEDINALPEKIQKKKNTTANYKFLTSHPPKQLAKVWKRSKNNFHIKLSVIYRVSQKKVMIKTILIEMSWNHLILLSLSKK